MDTNIGYTPWNTLAFGGITYTIRTLVFYVLMGITKYR